MIYTYIFLLFEGLQSVLQAHPMSAYASHFARRVTVTKAWGAMERFQRAGESEVTNAQTSALTGTRRRGARSPAGTALALGLPAGAGLERAVPQAVPWVVSQVRLPFPPPHETLSVPCAPGST